MASLPSNWSWVEGGNKETKTIILKQGVCVSVCGGLKSRERNVLLQAPERVSVYVGACMLFSGLQERERERESRITNQKPWFVREIPCGHRPQSEASTTLCLHCLSQVVTGCFTEQHYCS